MTKPTVHDIARTAGVSLATVDRVLNGRVGVRGITVDRVQDAIRKLGFVRDQSAANLARGRQYRFVVFLPDAPSQFISQLRAGLRDAAVTAGLDRTVLTVVPVAHNDPHAMGRALAAVDVAEVSGIAIMAPETPQLRDSIARLRHGGVPVVALVANLPNSGCDHFVGINNTAAGATVAHLMGRFMAPNAGSVLVVASSMLARDSIERRNGFVATMAAMFPETEVLPTIEAHDDPDRMARILRTAMAAHPEVAGIYSLASGNQALLATLRTLGPPGHRIVMTHELTPATRAALEADEVQAVITQDVGHLVRSTVRVMRALSDRQPIIGAQERIRIEIILKENLP
jgi:LacI family transcriptional regulator